MILEGHHLSFDVGAKSLVVDISLTIEPSEIVAIIGPNGAGKSTLLRLLSGESQPTRGEVVVMANRCIIGRKITWLEREPCYHKTHSLLSVSPRDVFLMYVGLKAERIMGLSGQH